MKDWRKMNFILDCVRDLSDEGYQMRHWVLHEDPSIVSSYDNVTMYFLEDSENLLDAAADVGIPREQLTVLRKLYEMVEEYDESDDRPDADEEIVNDPRWLEIVAFAKKAYPILAKDPSSFC